MKTAISPTQTRVPRNRAPKGVDSIHRINVALMPAERAELQRRAAADGRTDGAMARIYLVRAMQADPSVAAGANTEDVQS